MNWINLFVALAAGAVVTVQAGSNAQLKQSMGSPILALVVNYVLGFAGIIAAASVARSHIPTFDAMTRTPWWAWVGGLLGLLYGLAVVLLANKMGAATLIATLVTGQLICSVILDHFGWMGFELHRASLVRVAGCALMIGGLALIAKF